LTSSTLGIIQVVNKPPDTYNLTANIPKNPKFSKIDLIYYDKDIIEILFVTLPEKLKILGNASIILNEIILNGTYLTITADYDWNNYSMLYKPKKDLIYSEIVPFIV